MRYFQFDRALMAENDLIFNVHAQKDFYKEKLRIMKNHPAQAGGISVPFKLRLPIRLKVGCQFAFHRRKPVSKAFDVIKNAKHHIFFRFKSFEDILNTK